MKAFRLIGPFGYSNIRAAKFLWGDEVYTRVLGRLYWVRVLAERDL